MILGFGLIIKYKIFSNNIVEIIYVNWICV
jgi:hypothetical protein